MTANRTVQVGDEQIRLEPFSGRKAIRVVRTIERITKGVPEILEEWARFTSAYEASHVTELDRAAARVHYAPVPLMDEDPILQDGEALTDQAGNVLVRRTPKLDGEGRPVMGPDPLGHMTDEDWAANGQRLRMPKSPGREEQIAAVFPKALELAERETLQLLALLAMTNAELKRAAAADLPAALDERSEELLDAPADDLLELAVAAGEMVESQFVAKVRSLGGRLPNALRLLGLSPRSRDTETTEETSTSSSSATSAPSSTGSPAPTDGESDEPSTAPVGVGSSPSLIG
jgi:hypothetical protein